MKFIKQFALLLQMGIAGWRQRPGSVLVTLIGVTCVVGVLVAMLSMGAGVRSLANQSVRSDRAVVLSKGAQSVFTSGFDRPLVATIEDMPGVRHGADGRPLATATTFVQAAARKKSDNARASFNLFGVDQQFFKVFPEWHLTAGRMFTPGLFEVVVGKSRHEQFKGLEVGDVIHLRGTDWKVVGHYDSRGGIYEGGLMGDVETVISIYRRNSTQAITVLLDSPSAFGTYSQALQSNSTLEAELKSEKQVVDSMTKGLTGIMDFISYFVGSVMALGGTLGAVNALYAMVDSRKREIATLRALGFGNGAIVLSVLVESLLIAIPGAILGVVLAWLFFNGNAVSPFGVAFKLVITPALAALGIIWALLMGLLGGLFPAIRAARVPVATALRAV